jgi:hypothetical protein
LGVRSLYLRTPMTFEIFSSLKSHIIRWPRHLVMVGGLCLLAACGGGGGGTTSGANGGVAPSPVLALISSAVYVNGKPAELLPTYSAGSGSITCKDSSNGTVVKQVANAVSGIPVSFTLTASVDCKLTVLYQDPNTVRTNLLPAESPIVPITVKPIDVLEPDVALTADNTAIQPGTEVTLSIAITDNGTLARINKVWLIPNNNTANAIDLGNASTTTYKVKPTSTTTYQVKLDYMDTRPAVDYQKQKYSDSVEVKVSNGPGMIKLGTSMSARSRFTATLLPADANNISYVLVTGGTQDGTKALQTAELYNPKTKEWIPLKNKMAVARFGHVATLLSDGSVLITGGQSDASGPLLASAEVYANGTFTKAKKDMAYGRIDHTATLIKTGTHKDKVLIAGGTVSSTTIVPDATVMEFYTPSEDVTTSTVGPFTSITAKKLSRPRKGHTASLLFGSIVVFVGNSIPGATDKLIEAYDTTDWSSVTVNLPTGFDSSKLLRWNHTATENQDNTSIVFAGGYGLNSKTILRLAANELTPATPASGTTPATAATYTYDLTEVIDLTTNRGGHTSTLLEDGNILIVGGDNGRTKVDTIELLNTSSDTLNAGLKLNTPRASHISIRLPTTDISSVLIMGNTQSFPIAAPITTEIWTSE